MPDLVHILHYAWYQEQGGGGDQGRRRELQEEKDLQWKKSILGYQTLANTSPWENNVSTHYLQGNPYNLNFTQPQQNLLQLVKIAIL